MRGYFALPEKPKGGGIVPGNSIWSVNSDLRAVADGYAALGFAVAGDLPVRSYVYAGALHGFDFAPPHAHSNHYASRVCDVSTVLALDRVLVRGEGL
jgi:hypothetical protein